MKKFYFLFFVTTLFSAMETSAASAPAQRNIAFRKAVYQSSAANFHNTGQLATDGVFTVDKRALHVCTDCYADNPPEEMPEQAFDGRQNTKWLTFHNTSWLQIRFADNKTRRAAYYSISSGNDGSERDPKDWQVEGSNDGIRYTLLDSRVNESFDKRNATKIYEIIRPGKYRYYRLNITANHGDQRTQLSEWDLLDAKAKTIIERPAGDAPPDSHWVSVGNRNEWIYVDLGATCVVRSVSLFWDAKDWATEYELQFSNDTRRWRTAYSHHSGKGGVISTARFDARSWLPAKAPETVLTSFLLAYAAQRARNAERPRAGKPPEIPPSRTSLAHGRSMGYTRFHLERRPEWKRFHG
jgi:hypothetical protein